MLLLALDTATPAVTVAVHDGTRLLAEVTAHDPRRHGELLAPGIGAVLAQAGVGRRDLTDVVVGTGPGPFTGLRVGLVTARTLALALGLGLHGVCTHDAMAAQALQESNEPLAGGFLVATDARRREVYWSRYDAGPGVHRLDGPHVSRPADVPADGRPVVGRGAELHPDLLGLPLLPLDPSAGALATYAAGRLAAGDDLGELEPRYLRRPDVSEPGPRRSVLR